MMALQPGATPLGPLLFAAASTGDLQAVKDLLGKQSDEGLTWSNDEGVTPLMTVRAASPATRMVIPRLMVMPSPDRCCTPAPCSRQAAEEGHAAVCEALLQGGCPWNQLDNDGYCAGQ